MRNELLHISKIKNPNVAADIVGHEQVGKGFSPSQVRGSALYYDLNEAPPSISGFGLFKDKVGNKIIALDMNRPQSQAIIQNNLLGVELREFTAQAGRHEWLSGGRSYTAPIICVRYGEPNFRRYEGMRANFQSDAAYKSYQQFVKNTGNEIANFDDMTTNGRFDWFKLLQQIETKKIKFSQPIVIYAMRRQKPFTFADFIEASFEVIAVVSQIASVAGLPIPPKIIETAKKAVRVLEGVDTVVKAAKDPKSLKLDHLLNTAELLAPEWTKGAIAKVESVKNQFGKQIDKVTWGKYLKNSTEITKVGTSAIFGDTQKLIEQKTGLSKDIVEQFIDRYNQNNISEALDLRKIKGSISSANKVLRNAANQLTSDVLSRKMQTGSLITEVIDRQNISSIPVLNDMFLSGNAGGILRAIPGCGPLIEKIITKESLDGLISNSNKSLISGVEGHAGLIASYFGHKVPDIAFDDFTLDAMAYRAKVHAKKNIPFILPDSIPSSRRAEFKRKIEARTDANVRYTEDGWDLSPSTMNLVKVGGAALVGWGGYEAYKYWKKAE